MLKAVRNELKSDISTVGHRLETLGHRLESKIDMVLAKVERSTQLNEEQNHRNKIVLEGLGSLFDRQERVESRMSSFERLLATLPKRQIEK